MFPVLIVCFVILLACTIPPPSSALTRILRTRVITKLNPKFRFSRKIRKAPELDLALSSEDDQATMLDTCIPVKEFPACVTKSLRYKAEEWCVIGVGTDDHILLVFAFKGTASAVDVDPVSLRFPISLAHQVNWTTCIMIHNHVSARKSLIPSSGDRKVIVELADFCFNQNLNFFALICGENKFREILGFFYESLVLPSRGEFLENHRIFSMENCLLWLEFLWRVITWRFITHSPRVYQAAH